MDSLPLELQVNILKNITIFDYCNVSLSCKLFKNILKSDCFQTFWKYQKVFDEFYKSDRKIDDLFLKSVINEHPDLVSYFIQKEKPSPSALKLACEICFTKKNNFKLTIFAIICCKVLGYERAKAMIEESIIKSESKKNIKHSESLQ